MQLNLNLFIFCLIFLQIQELETENSELKQQLQDLEEQLMVAHVPPVRTNWTNRIHDLNLLVI